MPPSQPFALIAGGTAIGTVHFYAWDDGMAVATGTFRPSEHYRVQEHATQIGDTQLTHPEPPRLSWNDGSNLECDAVILIDCSDEAGDEGREVIAWGVADVAFRNGS